MRVVGLISGTSADGIEAAVVEISGTPPELEWRLLKTRPRAAPAGSARGNPCLLSPRDRDRGPAVCAQFAIGAAFAAAALDAIRAAGLEPSQIDLIGSHGQSLWHIPSGPKASTLQLGKAPCSRNGPASQPFQISGRATWLPAGRARRSSRSSTSCCSPIHAHRAAQNIGGIGNVTFLPPVGAKQNASPLQPFAFDTGPAIC